MQTMPELISWHDVALRLAWTVLSGALIGYNRREHGKAAGMRTTLLVCLAASVSMIQMNLLMPVAGKTGASFAVMDLMRLPLGILTGVGFIGAGVILRRGEIVAGVTTAATLWMVTVIGLCFGGGQLDLGWIATAIALATLWGLGWVELRIRAERKVKLIVEIEEAELSEEEIRGAVARSGLRVVAHSVSADRESRRRRFEFDMLELRLPTDAEIPPFVETLSRRPGIVRCHWGTLS